MTDSPVNPPSEDRALELLTKMVEEALELRHGSAGDSAGAISMPPPEAGVRDVLAVLLRVRSRLDRLEGVLQRAVRLRALVHRMSATTRMVADEAWDRASVNSRAPSVRRGEEFTGPRERYADNNLATLQEARAAKAGERMAAQADAAVEVIRLAHRGLDGVRQDLIAWLRTLQFESHLER
jgi:hypothetical protein